MSPSDIRAVIIAGLFAIPTVGFAILLVVAHRERLRMDTYWAKRRSEQEMRFAEEGKRRASTRP